jgi:hypothetical protein
MPDPQVGQLTQRPNLQEETGLKGISNTFYTVGFYSVTFCRANLYRSLLKRSILYR